MVLSGTMVGRLLLRGSLVMRTSSSNPDSMTLSPLGPVKNFRAVALITDWTCVCPVPPGPSSVAGLAAPRPAGSPSPSAA